MILSFLWLLLTITAGGIYFYGNTEIVLPVLTFQLAFAVAVLGAAALAQRFKRAALVCLLVAAALAGVLREEQVLEQWRQGVAHWQGKPVLVEGVLAEQAVIEEEPGWVRGRLACYVVGDPGGTLTSCTQSVWLKYPAGDTGVGDVLRVEGKLSSNNAFRDEGQVQRERMLAVQEIAGTLKAKTGMVRVLRHPGAYEWGQWRFSQWREALTARVAERLSPETAGVLNGMLFGGYAGIAPETAQNFRDTGLVHILSVSGSHVSLLGAMLLWLGSWMNLGKKSKVAFVGAGIVLYACIAGWCAPVARSVCMGLVALGALAWRREKEAVYSLALCAWGLLLFQPLWLWDIGFQLSFFATAGLILLAPQALKCLQTWRVPVVLGAPLAITWGAQMASLPLLAFYFQQFSLVSFLANLLVLPLLESAMIFGLGSLAAGLILGDIILTPVWGLCQGLVYLGSFLASLCAKAPGALAYVPPPGALAGAAYFAALTIFWRRTLPALQQGGLWLVVCALWLGPWLWLPPELEVHMLDVGEGDALVVLTPHRHAWVVDAGGVWRQGDAGSKVVVPHLRRLGVSKLQGIVLTHGHADHMGGAQAVLYSFPCRYLMAPTMEKPGQSALQLALPAGLSVCRIPPGEGVSWEDDGVSFYALRSPGGLVKGENDESLVVWLAYGEKSFLLTGDAKLENSWLPRDLHCDVLKMPHHGSRFAWEAEALAKLAPQIALISVGRNNSFGHPHAETLQELTRNGARVWRTDRDGTVRVFTDGHVLRLATTPGFGVH